MRFLFILCFVISYQLYAQVGFTQSGKASFYNDRFHGAKTNSGEKYDMNAFTAAHRELPLNTKIKVTNLKNNKSVIVRINDRGPFHHVRILDVSKAAAKELDMISQGVANVTLEVVELPNEPVKDTKSIATPTSPAKPNKTSTADTVVLPAKTEAKHESKEEETPSKTTHPEPLPAKSIAANANENVKPEPEKPKVDLKEASSEIFKAGYIYNIHGMIQNPKGYGIQVGSFSHIFNSLRFCKYMTDMGFSKIFIKADKEPNGTAYRVLIGDYASEEDANLDTAKLREKNRDYLIKKYPENKDLP
ncbi:MAG TPA: septal ring lytic transglycosylase RlpA family protein [Leptospiraceae bacterium]|nr:septal ring lytic transglycosylase RlpA family protein [Leptospiraceae bacterium]HMX33771.1 septal ring lytic transglycosylase RlpA family protein [Leptospiraceae bacterium]HMY31153.1 septal ring lytic transglycosylase RlpA family protein [Leptospiraceae bacterium]HMZ66664.1 septal ring lytic transglycosylase RlpA family protein [Leptospiraceae bacterium]HNB97387.1 septal ring lytic transglycosylase RlpA family protein [Leptospiraceae bacterium]